MPTPATPDPTHGRLPSIYAEHHGWLRGWLTRRLGNPVDAADLAQDTFVRLLSAPASTPERQRGWVLDEPRAYLTVVARRLMASLLRRRSLEQAWLEALASVPPALAPSPEDRLLILETLNDVDAMLDGLRPLVREVFLLAQLEGLAYRDIATRFNLSERTVKRYVAEALARCILLAEP